MVPGIIGSLQALEAIKIIAAVGEVLSGRMLILDALAGTFRTVKLRPRKEDAVALIKTLVDYEEYCGTSAHDKDKPLEALNPKEDRISAVHLSEKRKRGEKFLLLDVRTKIETEICHLPDSINIPLEEIRKAEGQQDLHKQLTDDTLREIIVLCRRGNDSQLAVLKLRELLKEVPIIKDVTGGLRAWASHVDKDFPVY